MQSAKGTRKIVKTVRDPTILTGHFARQTPRAMHMRSIQANTLSHKSMAGPMNRELENFVPNMSWSELLKTRTVRQKRGNLPFNSPRAKIRAASITAHTRAKTKRSPVANTWKPKSILKKPQPKSILKK